MATTSTVSDFICDDIKGPTACLSATLMPTPSDTLLSSTVATQPLPPQQLVTLEVGELFFLFLFPNWSKHH